MMREGRKGRADECERPLASRRHLTSHERGVPVEGVLNPINCVLNQRQNERQRG